MFCIILNINAETSVRSIVETRKVFLYKCRHVCMCVYVTGIEKVIDSLVIQNCVHRFRLKLYSHREYARTHKTITMYYAY